MTGGIFFVHRNRMIRRKYETIGVHLSADLANGIKLIAKKERRSVSSVAAHLIELQLLENLATNRTEPAGGEFCAPPPIDAESRSTSATESTATR